MFWLCIGCMFVVSYVCCYVFCIGVYRCLLVVWVLCVCIGFVCVVLALLVYQCDYLLFIGVFGLCWFLFAVICVVWVCIRVSCYSCLWVSYGSLLVLLVPMCVVGVRLCVFVVWLKGVLFVCGGVVVAVIVLMVSMRVLVFVWYRCLLVCS